jgi:Rrf2 family protein
MLYSKSAEYAIQAMIYLAELKSEKPVMVREIAEAYGIPSQFLSKIMQTLVKQRLINATRGRKGGITLNKPAREIYLNQIINAIDGPPPEKEQCVVGLDLCSDETPCPLHEQWKPIRLKLRNMLDSESLDILAKRVLSKRKIMRG